jgi:hypothetical protein
MNRRAFIGVLAVGAAGLGGCLAESDDNANGDGPADGARTSPAPAEPTETDGNATPTEPADQSGTTEPGTDEPSNEGGTVTGEFVRELFAVPELVAPDSPDSFGVFGDRDEQFVVARLDARGGAAPAVEDLALSVDGETYTAETGTDTGYGGWALFDYEAAYDPDDDPRGWLYFTLANPVDADEAALTWPGGESSLGESERAELARSPTDFEVQSFEAPEVVDVGERAEATLTVENTGDADGVFVAAVNRSGPRVAHAPDGAVRLSVPAGETRTWTYEHTVEWDDMSTERPMRVFVHWRDDSVDREITVRPEQTATPTE